MWSALILFGLALAYGLLKIYFEKRLAPLDDVGEDRRLADLAFANGCSVFDLFKSAGEDWQFSNLKIGNDFRQYLLEGLVPHYVGEYVRRHQRAEDRTYQKLIFSGGRPPYL